MFRLEFENLLSYDAGQVGIDLDVSLQIVGKSVDFTAKIDTGSSHCIFERKHGEELGLEIETGMPQRFGTATGGFLAYGHEITLVTAGFIFDSIVFFPHEETINKNVLRRFGWLDRVVLGLID